MTAAVIVQLAQEGRLDLDDPVSKYVSGVPDGDQITIADLLKMRSGLYNYTDAPEFAAILDQDPTKVWTPEEVLTIAFKHPPYFPPGTAFHYDNTNYALLGLIAEEREHGKPLARVLQDRLFGPLGMKDTALPASTSNTLPDPYSHGYMYGISFALVDHRPSKWIFRFRRTAVGPMDPAIPKYELYPPLVKERGMKRSVAQKGGHVAAE
jgi:D-alanyl-D-alanine carboxypeptidase